MALDTSNDASSISITRRNDRSFLMSVIQFLIRRFRTQISNREPKHEDGSIRLKPPKSKLDGCNLHERNVCDIYLYEFETPQKRTIEVTKRIYYFAGSSWQGPPSGQHYQLCATIAKAMPDTIVSLVSPPQAPNNPAPSAFPWCMRLYRALMAEAGAAGQKVILAGDSSGANIVLSLALEALKEDEETQAEYTKTPYPVAIMTVCPSTDLTRNNPDIQKIAPRDPLLTPAIINSTSKEWQGEWDPADRRISPVNNDISLLATKGIKVHGITAGCDVLSPDGIVFRDRCAAEGVKGEWVHWQNQMHCFVLTLPYGLQEAKDGVKWMIDVLRKE